MHIFFYSHYFTVFYPPYLFDCLFIFLFLFSLLYEFESKRNVHWPFCKKKKKKHHRRTEIAFWLMFLQWCSNLCLCYFTDLSVVSSGNVNDLVISNDSLLHYVLWLLAVALISFFSVLIYSYVCFAVFLFVWIKWSVKLPMIIDHAPNYNGFVVSK